jgi:hypothetical protein
MFWFINEKTGGKSCMAKTSSDLFEMGTFYSTQLASIWSASTGKYRVRDRSGDAGAVARDLYSAHSMQATFITTTLENGAQLEDVLKSRWPPRPEHHQAVRPPRV